MSAIVIGVRVRPFNQRELKFNSTNIVGMPTDRPGLVTLKVVRQGKILPDPPREFNFDHAFWTHDGEGGFLPDGSPATNKWADQQHVFEVLGRPVLKNVLDGYNATLFAYGQTGSGKTYTMMGYPPNDVGITPRICDELFSSLAEMSAEADEFQLTTECSYLEIYNEEVHDLLAKERADHGLKVRQHPKTGVFVEGLRKVIVTQANDVLQILSDGNTARTVAATNMNASSSRSHAIVTITVSLTMTKKGVIQGKYAKLVLVDLAGSERASSTGATGGTLVEGANINKSLTTLGMVLGRLADQAETGKSLPVPFRDSSLTFLLHDSFGGNSRTAMFANISPADVNYDETLSTLRFAAVTKRVKNKAVVNENPAAKLIRELTEELAGLKEKLSALKEKRVHTSLGVGNHAEGAGGGDALGENVDQGPSEDPSEEEAKLKELIEEGLAAQDSLVVAEDMAAVVANNEGSADEAGGSVNAVLSTEKKGALFGSSHEVADGVVFVDWHAPHLINLCPDSRSLILSVTAGDSYVVISDSTNPASGAALTPTACGHLKIHYSPLLNAVYVERIGSSASSPSDARGGESDALPIFINGLALASGTPTALEHGDRLAIGALLFRVSHTTNIPTATPYSRLYRCEEHIYMAEAYHRYYIIHKWASTLASIVREIGEGGGAIDIDGSPKRGTLPRREGADGEEGGSELLALTAEEIAAANPMSAIINGDHIEGCSELEFAAVTDLRHAENDLVAQFPVSNVELAFYAREFQERGKGAAAASNDVKKQKKATGIDSSAKEREEGRDAPPTDVSSPTRETGALDELTESVTPRPEEEEYDPMLAPMVVTSSGGLLGGGLSLEQLRQWSSEGSEEYLRARKEHEDALKAQEAMIESLKRELENFGKEQQAVAESSENDDARGVNEAGGEPFKGANSVEEEREAVERALAAELKWHQDVRILRNYRQGGPIDEKDAATWRFYAEGAKSTFPFLSQILSEQEQFYESMAVQQQQQAEKGRGEGSVVPIVDVFSDLRVRRGSNGVVASPSVGSASELTMEGRTISCLSGGAAMSRASLEGDGSMQSSSENNTKLKKTKNFAERFGRRGSFLKMKQSKEKWDLRYYLIVDHFLYYFYSCVGTYRCLGALYLKGSSISYVGSHGGQQHVVLVKLAAPRRADDPKDNSFYFGFATQKDAALWCHWMSIASTPPMPHTMVDRLTREAVAQFESGTVSLTTHHQFYPVNPLLLGLTDIRVTAEGDAALAQWKNDEQVTNCENCNVKFTFFNRRHHCRTCGGIFCGVCAPKFGKENARTCVPCQGHETNASGVHSNNATVTLGEQGGDTDTLEETVITVPSADVANLSSQCSE